ncbi:Metallo-hydrolase/oxidoreductase [Xylariaceae sp. FL0016]|nr:Metallo-hydrolase/oxidoreductase [Xylariaceae sp. FL0016]
MAVELVHLPEVERLSPSCIRILGGNPSKFTLQGTNTYLVGTGSERLLVDTGEGKPSWISALKRLLDQEKATVQKVLLTHWHPDHTGGVSQLLDTSHDAVIFKSSPGPSQQNIAHGQVFEVEGATLKAVHTPGHTTDHMAFIFKEEDAIFTGDNVLGQGTAVFEDLSTYMTSLAKMENLVSGRGYPGHGPVLPAAQAKISEYISHRQQRETQVLETLGSLREIPASTSVMSSSGKAGATPMELVKIIYRDVPENLHLPAARGVVQILHKLQDEDKVLLEDGDRWSLRERPSL